VDDNNRVTSLEFHELDKNLAGLFKPGGSKPVINTRLARLEEIQKKLRHAADGIKEYEGLVDQRQKLGETISRFQQEGEVLRKDQTRISYNLKLWDQWIVLQEAEDKLENLADTVSVFPADGLSKMSNLEKNLEKSMIKGKKESNRSAKTRTGPEN